jgi:hypothetical protein
MQLFCGGVGILYEICDIEVKGLYYSGTVSVSHMELYKDPV